jgi:hypothetical protein
MFKRKELTPIRSLFRVVRKTGAEKTADDAAVEGPKRIEQERGPFRAST